jgi:hypothetical protein
MWLLHVSSLKLVEHPYNNPPAYAILSHTWGPPAEEVLFKDMIEGTAHDKKAFIKLEYTVAQAKKDELNYCWIDTCCIDKSSSAELQEAINSMFSFYEKAATCYVFLSDVPHPTATLSHVSSPSYGRMILELDTYHQMSEAAQRWRDKFVSSKWFTRGWTLQELIAPRNVFFYDEKWRKIGSKRELVKPISEITGIREDCLLRTGLMRFEDWCRDTNVCVAERMSWAAKRQTSRPEDRAYSLMGLFSVNMPMLYGEGDRAFLRLQEEILKHTKDHSIFAWRDPLANPSTCCGLLARHPSFFSDTSDVRVEVSTVFVASDRDTSLIFESAKQGFQAPILMSGGELTIEASLWRFSKVSDVYMMVLRDVTATDREVIGIVLVRDRLHQTFARINAAQLLGVTYMGWGSFTSTKISVAHTPYQEKSRFHLPESPDECQFWYERPHRRRQLWDIRQEIKYIQSQGDIKDLWLSHSRSPGWSILGWIMYWNHRNDMAPSSVDGRTLDLIDHKNWAGHWDSFGLVKSEKLRLILWSMVKQATTAPDALAYGRVSQNYEGVWSVRMKLIHGEHTLSETEMIAADLDKSSKSIAAIDDLNQILVSVGTEVTDPDIAQSRSYLMIIPRKVKNFSGNGWFDDIG